MNTKMHTIGILSDTHGLLREEAYFHQPLTDSVVCVKSENGLPVSVSDGDALLPVREVGGVYWLGETGTEAESEKILSALNQIADQGVSIVVPHEENRFLSVRIGKMIFGEKLPPLAAAGEESDEETDTTNAE